MQTDNTLIVANSTFTIHKEEEIKHANILCKPWEQLISGKSLKFNGAIITEDCQGVTLTQEHTYTKIRPIQDQPADTTNSRGKVQKAASPYKQYVT
jgi:hypothetical protein